VKVFSRKITYKAGEIFSLIAYGDVHWGAKYCDENLFAEMFQEYKGNPNAYFVDLGDTCNSIHVKDPRFDFRELAPRFEGRQDLIDAQISDYCNYHTKYGDPSRELGKISGNHTESIIKHHGTNPTKRMCEMLDIKYLGLSCYFWLEFEHEAGGCVRKYLIYLHHGWGGAIRSEGGNLNKYMKILSRYDFDIALLGHNHEGWFKPTARIGAECRGDNRKLVHKKQITGEVPSFLKTLSDDEAPTYSEARGFFPIHMGWLEIQIDPRSGKTRTIQT